MGVNLPSFFGYNIAQSGILASQAAMNVINNNISSANLPGYSRQRAELAAANPYTNPNLVSNGTPGQFGQGVLIQDVTRAHDIFIDGQYRTQTSNQSYYGELSDVMKQIENILGELGGRPISDSLRDFFASAADLSANPDNIAVRQQFIQRAGDLLFTFQQQGQQLADLRRDLVGDAAVASTISNSQLSVEINEVNEILAQVADLNQQIAIVSSGGASPNTLMDQRDVLLDKLSEKMNFDITRTGTNTNISLNGNNLVIGRTVVNDFVVVANPGPGPPTPTDQPSNVNLSVSGATVNSSFTGGEIGGILRMGGVTAGEASIQNILVQMNTLFTEIATDLNGLQAVGRDLNGNIPVAPNNEIYTLAAGTSLAMFRYSVNANIVADPTLIAAASNVSGAFEGVGDGRNALLMAQLENSVANAALGNISYGDYNANMISALGVRSSSTKNEYDASTDIVFSINERRSAVQGVNIDEEMVNLVKFQRSLEASSRAFRSIDEVVQTIISMVR